MVFGTQRTNLGRSASTGAGQARQGRAWPSGSPPIRNLIRRERGGCLQRPARCEEDFPGATPPERSGRNFQDIPCLGNDSNGERSATAENIGRCLKFFQASGETSHETPSPIIPACEPGNRRARTIRSPGHRRCRPIGHPRADTTARPKPRSCRSRGLRRRGSPRWLPPQSAGTFSSASTTAGAEGDRRAERDAHD